jgi:hypothetical protein
MPDELPADYEEDAPTEEDVRKGFSATAAAFLANRDKPPEERRAAIKAALRGAHDKAPDESFDEEQPPRKRRGIVIRPKKQKLEEQAINEYSPQQGRSTNAIIAFIALLISLPLLFGAVYDAINPQSATVDDSFTHSYEQFKIDRYEKMTDRDLRFSDLIDEEKMRETYNKIADEHWKLVAGQTRRHLLMYGALFLASLSYLLYAWREVYTQARRNTAR